MFDKYELLLLEKIVFYFELQGMDQVSIVMLNEISVYFDEVLWCEFVGVV